MGGDYETEVEAPRVKGQAGGGAGGVEEVLFQGVRCHLNGAFVHCHDDKQGLKVYIPKAIWWAAIERLRTPAGEGDQGESFEFKDVDNQSRILIKTELRGTALHTQAGIYPFVPPETYDRAWVALENFTNKTTGR